METYVVRVWLPDRPGALGQVASRVGAVRGDVVGIDILERDGGQVIDELIVELPDNTLVELLVAEITAVDGVAVEDIRIVPNGTHDPHLDALEAAALLVSAKTPDELIASLVQHAHGDFGAEWVVALTNDTLDTAEICFSVGDAPGSQWLAAFIDGSRLSNISASAESGLNDVAWSAIPSAGQNLILGRQGRPFRVRERRQIAVLARIADTRWSEVAIEVVGQSGGG
ncbi:MAG: hypothetical protein ACSLFB_06710 [Acidimicrobiales bacterium]